MIDRDALFRSLADPTRRAIFETLCRDGDLPVTALTRGANISQPAVSKHLGVGRQAGRQTFYHAEPETLKAVADWMAEMRGFWERRLDKFEDLLNRMDQ
jgi:DNA-binding transcriptional ArsR family regulator